MTRDALQNIAIKQISEEYYSPKMIYFAEIGTGGGKTRILLQSALKILKEHNISVIIATSNNALVDQYISEAKTLNFSTDDIDIIIGKSNFIDPSQFTDENLNIVSKVSDSIKNLDALKRWFDQSLYKLAEDFKTYFNMPEECVKLFCFSSIVDENVLDDNDKTPEDININDYIESFSMTSRINQIVSEKKIYITNHHYYLIAAKLLKSNSELFNIPLLIDEVHLLNDAATSILSNKFSLFTTQIELDRKIEDELLAQKHKKLIINFKIKLSNMRNFANSLNVKSFTDGSASNLLINSLKELYKSSEYEELKELISKKSRKIVKMPKLTQLTIANMLNNIALIANSKDARVTFSPTKSYPSFVIQKNNIEYELRNCWIKNNAYICGVSGTLQISNNTTIESNRWSFERLGFLPYNKVDEREERMSWNHRVSISLVFKVFESVFSKNQAKHYIFDDEKYRYPILNTFSTFEDKEDAVQSWLTNIADAVSKVRFGNMLVLIGSTENACDLASKLKTIERFNEYQIIYSNHNKSMRSTQKEYMSIIDSGQKAVLVGNISFFTGVDMPGDYINSLVITKLPYEPLPPQLNKIKTGVRSLLYVNRMKALIQFRQGIGRCIRKPEDKALIVVCDPRINKDKENSRSFMHFLTRMSEKVS